MKRISEVQRLKKEIEDKNQEIAEIQKKCKHHFKINTKFGNTTSETAPVKCSKCELSTEIHRDKVCEICFKPFLERLGKSKDDVVNSCTRSKYKCVKCSHIQLVISKW